MATSSSTTSSLIAITVSCSGESLDFSVPPRVPLAEILPGVVDSFGRLDPRTASAGYTARTASGRRLDQSAALADQGVKSGALISLVPIGEGAADRRYDDLVEAVGVGVEEDVAPWTREDSLRLSAHASAALVLVAAVLLVVSAPASFVTAGIAGAAALLVAGAAALVSRSASPIGALSLAATAPLLTAVAAIALVGGGWGPTARVAAGTGALLGALAHLVLPAGLRPSIAAPLVAGGALGLAGALSAFAGVADDRAAALVLALLLVAVLAAPWLALVQVPVRVTGPNVLDRVDPDAVRSRMRLSEVFVVAFKAGAALAALILAPQLASSASGIALVACTGVALMLSTRSIRSRSEVLIGVVAGMVLTVGAALAAAVGAPVLAPGIAIAVVAVAVVLLVANVVDARMRPWLTRLADALGVLVLLAIAPLAALVWGVL